MTSGWIHVSYGLNSLKGGIWDIIWGSIIVVIIGDTRSLDYSSYNPYVELKHTPYHNMIVPIFQYPYLQALDPETRVQKSVWEVLEFTLNPKTLNPKP